MISRTKNDEKFGKNTIVHMLRPVAESRAGLAPLICLSSLAAVPGSQDETKVVLRNKNIRRDRPTGSLVTPNTSFRHSMMFERPNPMHKTRDNKRATMMFPEEAHVFRSSAAYVPPNSNKRHSMALPDSFSFENFKASLAPVADEKSLDDDDAFDFLPKPVVEPKTPPPSQGTATSMDVSTRPSSPEVLTLGDVDDLVRKTAMSFSKPKPAPPLRTTTLMTPRAAGMSNEAIAGTVSDQLAAALEDFNNVFDNLQNLDGIEDQFADMSLNEGSAMDEE